MRPALVRVRRALLRDSIPSNGPDATEQVAIRWPSPGCPGFDRTRPLPTGRKAQSAALTEQRIRA